MSLRLYNTLSGTEETFVPLKEGEVRMYVCGMTVYDQCHVGHARSLVTFDIIVRYLRFLGYNVTFVRNFTDVDDKIIQRSREEGVSASALAERYIQTFYRDGRALGLVKPTYEPKATDHIAQMIELIQRLEQKGIAYRVNGDVFFDVGRFSGYGKLSGKKIEDLEAGARVEVDARKRHPMDFALWKQSKEGEPAWDSPWGKGRPGWHIECSAMSRQYLGQPFDIHGGGMDLIFPHHENEIAQSEAAFGSFFVRYWIHNGFVNINQEKMSKSLGNFYTIQDVLERHDAVTLRYFLLSSHYRRPVDFSMDALEDAEKAVGRLYESIDRLDRMFPAESLRDPDRELLADFRSAMDDDFNTPRALAVLFEEIRSLNRRADEGGSRGLEPRLAALKTAGGVLGLLQEDPAMFFQQKKTRWLQAQQLSPESIEAWIRKRDAARREKRWQDADRIRSELKEKGIILEDSVEGTTWKVE